MPVPLTANRPAESVCVFSSCTPPMGCCVSASMTWPVSLHVSVAGGVTVSGWAGFAGFERWHAAEINANARIRSHTVPFYRAGMTATSRPPCGSSGP